jgi:hypothetical protein
MAQAALNAAFRMDRVGDYLKELQQQGGGSGT